MAFLNETVIQMLHEKTGLEFRQSKDYAVAAQMITEATGEYLSDNTLRRLMGVKEDAGTPRMSTLDIIAHYFNYPNWDEFALDKHIKGPDSDSIFILDSTEIISSLLIPMQELTLYYQPNRMTQLRFLGDEKYQVIDSNSSKLHPGDILYIHNIVEKQTLYVSKVERNGIFIGQYTAGEVGGITKIQIN